MIRIIRSNSRMARRLVWTATPWFGRAAGREREGSDAGSCTTSTPTREVDGESWTTFASMYTRPRVVFSGTARLPNPDGKRRRKRVEARMWLSLAGPSVESKSREILEGAVSAWRESESSTTQLSCPPGSREPFLSHYAHTHTPTQATLLIKASFS